MLRMILSSMSMSTSVTEVTADRGSALVKSLEVFGQGMLAICVVIAVCIAVTKAITYLDAKSEKKSDEKTDGE